MEGTRLGTFIVAQARSAGGIDEAVTLERRREKSETFIFFVELMGLEGWIWDKEKRGVKCDS